MTELITIDQANKLMLALLLVAPAIGLIWGLSAKQVKTGVFWGVAVGIANFVLWRVYNGITDRLGLDTVKNLLVNLGLFLLIGLIGGFVAGSVKRKARSAVVEGSEVN